MGSRWLSSSKIDLAELANERWILTAPDAWNHKFVAEAFQSRGLDMPNISPNLFRSPSHQFACYWLFHHGAPAVSAAPPNTNLHL